MAWMDGWTRIHGLGCIWQCCTRIRFMHALTCFSNATQSACPSFIANASAVIPCCGGECMHNAVSITEHKQRFLSKHTHSSGPLSPAVAYPHPRQTCLSHCANSKAGHDPKYRSSRSLEPIDNPIALPLTTRPHALNIIHRTNYPCEAVSHYVVFEVDVDFVVFVL